MSHNNIALIELNLKAEIQKAMDMYVVPSEQWDEYKRERRTHFKTRAMNRKDLEVYRANKGDQLRDHVNTIAASLAAVMELLLDYQACCQVEKDRKTRKQIREETQNKRAKGNLEYELIKKAAREEELKRLAECDIVLVGEKEEKEEEEEEEEEIRKEHVLLQENEILKHKNTQQQEQLEQLLQKQQQQIQMLLEQQEQKQKKNKNKNSNTNTNLRHLKVKRSKNF